MPVSPKFWGIADEVARERERQEQLRREGRFDHTAASPSMLNAHKLTVLVEEVGEVASEVQALDGVCNDRGTGKGLRTELIQVAATAMAWLESL